MRNHASVLAISIACFFTAIGVGGAQDVEKLKKIASDTFLEYPVNVDAQSPPVRLLLAQESLRKLVKDLRKRWYLSVYFDGTTIKIKGNVDGRTTKGTDTAITASLRD